MKDSGVNFRHLYYFWVVAKEGGITRAATRMGLAIQTVSTQLGLLEQSLGKSLFTQQGRRLVLTEAGRTALSYADQIFLLGEQMQDALGQAETARTRLTVGISDSLPKPTAFRLLEATMQLTPPVRLICNEGPFDALLTDRPVRSGTPLRVFSHLLLESPTIVVGSAPLAEAYSDDFPRSLDRAPFLLPTRNNVLRGKIDEWFDHHNVRPDVVGEFDDNALLATFGRRGAGLFFASSMAAADMKEQFGATLVGDVPQVREQCYAISNERKIAHPAVEAIMSAVHQGVLHAP